MPDIFLFSTALDANQPDVRLRNTTFLRRALPYKLFNRVKVNTATTGTGVVTIGGAVSLFQTPASAGVNDGDTIRYVIEDGTDWEIGYGTYAAAGPTLTRNIDRPDCSSSTGALLNLSGAATVMISEAAYDINSPGKMISDSFAFG